MRGVAARRGSGNSFRDWRDWWGAVPCATASPSRQLYCTNCTRLPCPMLWSCRALLPRPPCRRSGAAGVCQLSCAAAPWVCPPGRHLLSGSWRPSHLPTCLPACLLGARPGRAAPCICRWAPSPPGLLPLLPLPAAGVQPAADRACTPGGEGSPCSAAPRCVCICVVCG
jgi:hypothetical protein